MNGGEGNDPFQGFDFFTGATTTTPISTFDPITGASLDSSTFDLDVDITNSGPLTDPNHIPWFLLPQGPSQPQPQQQQHLLQPQQSQQYFQTSAGYPQDQQSFIHAPTPAFNNSQPASGNQKDGAARLKSCAACRIRRVKCERDEGETDCKKCKEKGLNCTPMPSVPRKPAQRSGKRIETAKALFGTDSSSSDSSAAGSGSGGIVYTNNQGTKRLRIEGEPDVNGRGQELSLNSVVGRLVTTELEGALSASLVDLYFALPSGRISLIEEGTNFRQTFQSANRRITELNPHDQVLLSVILALSSRVSDHPLLVGSNPPTLLELNNQAQLGQDLSEWGKRREDACDALTKKAIRLADERGIWREASPSNVATLLILEGLVDHNSGIMSKSRPYGDAYMRQLRELLENDPDGSMKEALMGSGLGWVCYMRDATHSAQSGHISPITQDDFDYLLLEGEWSNIPKLAAAMKTPEFELESGIDGNFWKMPFWILFRAFMIHISEIARDYPLKLTGLGAMKRPIQQNVIRDLMERLRYGAEAAVTLEHRALMALGDPHACSENDKSHWSFVRVLRINRCGLVFLLRRALRLRLEKRPPAPRFEEVNLDVLGLREDSDEVTYWKMVETLSVEADRMAFEAARETIGILRNNLVAGMSFGVVTGAQMLFSRLPTWITVILNQSTEEEGGLRGFTFDEKIADLRTVYQALGAIGWAFEKLARPAPWIKQEIYALELKQALYNQQHIQPLLFSQPSPAGSTSSSGSGSSGGATGSEGQLSEAELNNMLEDIVATFSDGGVSGMNGFPQQMGFGGQAQGQDLMGMGMRNGVPSGSATPSSTDGGATLAWGQTGTVAVQGQSQPITIRMLGSLLG